MQVAIHAGTRFTDEGDVLRLLKANAAVVHGNGAAFWGFRAYKNIFRSALGVIGDRPPEAETLAKFETITPDDREISRAILYRAEYLGENPTTIMDGQFYPHAGKRIALMDQLFADAQIELFVALRNPGTYIPKVLMSLSQPERDRILATTDLSCLSWLSVIEDLRDLAPDVKITLWSNEDSPLLQGEIVRALARLPEDLRLRNEYKLLSSLVSETGRQQIQDLRQQDLSPNDPTVKEALATIFRDHALAHEIEEEVELPGWDQDVVAAFTELYEQDLARLQTMPDIRFLRP